MVWLILIIIWLTLMVVFGWDLFIRDKKPKKLKPEDYEFGRGDDIPLPNSSYQELEKWWIETESDKAKIQTLQSELNKYRDRIIKYGYGIEKDLWFITSKQKQEIQDLKEKIEALENRAKDDFLIVFPNGPREFPENTLVHTELKFEGRELVQWEQHFEKSPIPKETKQWSSMF